MDTVFMSDSYREGASYIIKVMGSRKREYNLFKSFPIHACMGFPRQQSILYCVCTFNQSAI